MIEPINLNEPINEIKLNEPKRKTSEAQLKANKKWNSEHKDKVKESSIKYNKKTNNKHQLAYYHAHLEEVKIYQAEYRAKKKLEKSKLNLKADIDWREHCKEQINNLSNCPLSDNFLSIDF